MNIDTEREALDARIEQLRYWVKCQHEFGNLSTSDDSMFHGFFRELDCWLARAKAGGGVDGIKAFAFDALVNAGRIPIPLYNEALDLAQRHYVPSCAEQIAISESDLMPSTPKEDGE